MNNHRTILDIALPSIVTNITIPLLGLADLIISGHIGDNHSAVYIGAVSIGGLVFNMIYWIFGFLRMGTSGLTAQAFGSRRSDKQLGILLQASAVALICSAGIIGLQRPIEWMAGMIISPSAEVWQLAIAYFRIRIWAAPAALLLFAVNGWFIGMQNSRFPMYIAIIQNLINIAASAGLVFGLRMDVTGIALGTVISQYAGLAVAATLWHRHYRRTIFQKTFANDIIERQAHTPTPPRTRQLLSFWRECLQRKSMKHFFTVNSDIFLRTLCIIAVTCSFTSIGANQGDLILACNTLLIQFFTLFSYFIDGFALAGEALTGKNIGEKNNKTLYSCIRDLFIWGSGIVLGFTLLYSWGGEALLTLLTNDSKVIDAASTYYIWVVAIPLVSFAAFLWDGIFIGATATKPMLITLAAATCLFFFLFFGIPGIGAILPLPNTIVADSNHRLWFAFLGYLGVRSLLQTVWARKTLRHALLCNF